MIDRSAIHTEGLTKHYGDVRALTDLSLDVRVGEVLGFIGPNGAGKTTTIRTLLGLLRPTGGSATIFGLDVTTARVEISERLGYLPSDFFFDARLTGRRLIALAADLRGVSDLGQAAALAERFGAALDRPMGQLSSGNRQKIGLIQALFHRPELLILDEPTSGLDPLVQEEFLATVVEARDAGQTVFLSSHNLAEVERVCDRVAIVREGRLVAVESVRELREKRFVRVRVRFAEPVDEAELRAIPGVEDVHMDDGELRFRVGEDLDAAVKALARHRVVDLDVERPSLEETFLTFYGEPADER